MWGFPSLEHNVAFSFLFYLAQVFICWHITEGWVSEGNLVIQGTYKRMGGTGQRRGELLNNLSNWRFVLQIYVIKSHFVWHSQHDEVAKKKLYKKKHGLPSNSKQETLSSIFVFQKCPSVFLKVRGYLVKMLTDSHLSLPWTMSKADCWLVVDYLLIKDKGEWLDMSGTTLLQFEIQKFRTGSRSLIEYDNLLKIIQLPYFVFFWHMV